ncbi:HAMP domain-containing histidine kinase [bacterium]|nr:HAMP domain-containing histidine kinase [bacterium]
MRGRSFQFKIALVSLLFSGIALCAFGVLAWILFYRMGIDRIDVELRSWGQQQLSKIRVIREWQRFEQDMGLVFGRQGKPEPVILLVKDREGRIVYQSGNWPADIDPKQISSPGELNIQPVPSPRRRPDPMNTSRFEVPGRFRDVSMPGHTWRLGVMANEHVTMALGVDLDGFLVEMRRMRLAFLTSMPIALLLIAMAGWLVSRRALRPVRQVTATAKTISARGLDRRIPIETADDEFVELITVLNGMLDRLQESFQQATRFSADAAHELKTPLTILQGELEQALRDAPPDSAQQHLLGDLMSETLRLKAITQKLLLLSRADAGQLTLNLERINLVELIEEMADDAAILAPQLTIKKDLPREAFVNADADLIRQVLQNLASNAIKYNRPDGTILLRLDRDESSVRFTIANTGDPIPPEERDRIFNRFHRADKSRARRIDGVGLGLSLSREIVAAHRGKLILDELVDSMTTFTMNLPLSS